MEQNNNLNYPIIAFSSSLIHIARNESEILICSKTALNNGFYKKMKIIDSSGIVYNIQNAIKVKGYGFFGGYNIFLNQKIEVELIFNEPQTKIDIDSFKTLLLKKINKSFWDSGGNYKEIIKQVESLNDINKIIDYLSSVYYNAK